MGELSGSEELRGLRVHIVPRQAVASAEISGAPGAAPGVRSPREVMRRGWCALWVAVLIALPAHATPSMRLTYERGEDAERCPDETALRKGVEQRLGYDPFFPWADRTIVARIHGDKGKLLGTVELVDAQGIVRGSRELSAPTEQCGELISGMSLAISIAIDPASVDRVRAASATTSPSEDDSVAEWSAARAEEAPPKPVDKPTVRRTPRPRPAPATPLQFEVGGGADVGVEVAPAVALGPVIEAAIRRRSWSLGVEGRFLFGIGTTLRGVDVSSSVLEAAVRGCLSFQIPFVCAVASVGRLAVSGQRSDETLVARVGPRIGAEIALSRELALAVHADLAVNLGTQVVRVGAEDTWTSSRVAGLGGISLRGRFP